MSDLKEIVDAVNESVSKNVKEIIETTVKTEVKENAYFLEDKIKDLQLANKKLDEELLSQKLAFSKMEVKEAVKSKSIYDLLAEKTEDLNQMISDRNKGFVNMTINKAPAPILSTNITPTTPGGLVYNTTQSDPNIVPLQRTPAFFSTLFRSFPLTADQVVYTEMVNPEGSAEMVGEGNLKPQVDFEWKESLVQAHTAAAWIKVSKKALRNISQLSSEIDRELITQVELKADLQVYNGDGLSPNLLGAYTSATPFTAGSFALSIPSPNEYDVLTVALTQISTASVLAGHPAGFMADTIVLNPVDAASMKLQKATDGMYIFPYAGYSGGTIMNVRVIENARIPAGEFMVFDSSKGNLGVSEQTNLEIGYEKEDFIKNFVTIRAEKTLVFYIKSQHVKAFVKGDFTTAKTAIKKP